IELDRALAAIGGVEIGGAEMAAVLGGDKGWSPGARIVARSLAFHLDDVRAEVGKDLARPGTGENAGEFEHANPCERTRHQSESSCEAIIFSARLLPAIV